MTRTFTFVRLGVLSALLLPSLFACVPSFDDDSSRVTTSRVLAVRSEPAEAKPGQEVQLSVLIASAEDAPEANEPRWAVCQKRKPLTELGPVAQECVDEFGTSSTSLTPIGRGESVTATLAEDVCRSFGPLEPPATGGQPSGRAVDPDPTGGYYQPVLVAAPDDAIVSLGSVRLTCGQVALSNETLIDYGQRYRPNENPALESLTLHVGRTERLVPARSSGERTQVGAGQSVTLEADWAACPREPFCGDGMCTSGEDKVSCSEDCVAENARGCSGSESYVLVNPATRAVVDRREGVVVAWYSTDGQFENTQTGRSEREPDQPSTTNRWTAPKSAGLVRLWAVIRDDRGGVGWQEYELEVE